MAKKRQTTAVTERATKRPDQKASADQSVTRDAAKDPSQVFADFEETTRAAEKCLSTAKAMLDTAVLNSPFEAVVMVAKALYQCQWNYFHLSRRHVHVMERIISVAETVDVNADYGIGLSATICHDIAWEYATSVLSVLHQYEVGGICIDFKSINSPDHPITKWQEYPEVLKKLPRIDSVAKAAEIEDAILVAEALHRHEHGRIEKNNKAFIFPDQLKSKWAAISDELKKLPRIDSKFDGAFQREAARTRQALTDEMKSESWPLLTPDELRKLFDISQDTLVRRLKSQSIPNRQITTKAYRVDPKALPENWRRILKKF